MQSQVHEQTRRYLPQCRYADWFAGADYDDNDDENEEDDD
jgi:hypothetical protein